MPKVDWKGASRHWLFRYGLSVLLFAAVLGLSIFLSRVVGIRINLTIPIVLALVAAAWYGGRGPGLLLSVLFQGTTIIYTATAPLTDLVQIFSWFSVFSLYVFLTFVISGLRSAQERLSSQRDLLQLTLTSIGDGVITTDAQGAVTFMNPVAERLTGWSEDTALGRPVEEVFSIFHEETGEKVSHPVYDVLRTRDVRALANHTGLRNKAGGEIPIDDSAAPIKIDDVIQGVILVFSDVSERKNAEKARRESEIMQRIVEAQESERHRIARDLHDHLGQRMTALRLGIESINDDHPDNGSLVRSIRELKSSASHIDRDIGFLSWELRPTELEYLGLVNALGSFVREWSKQYEIDADFHPGNVEEALGEHRLSRTVETNLYRIVQEALNNTLKHSKATNVSVLLSHRDDQLVLIIEDDGLGFDAETARDAGEGPGGLGLLGMEERAALLHGSLELDTTPGGGTTVIVRIPYKHHLNDSAISISA